MININSREYCDFSSKLMPQFWFWRENKNWKWPAEHVDGTRYQKLGSPSSPGFDSNNVLPSMFTFLSTDHHSKCSSKLMVIFAVSTTIKSQFPFLAQRSAFYIDYNHPPTHKHTRCSRITNLSYRLSRLHMNSRVDV